MNASISQIERPAQAGSEPAKKQMPAVLQQLQFGSRIDDDGIKALLLAAAEANASDIVVKSNTYALVKVHGVYYPVAKRLERSEVEAVLNFVFRGTSGYVKVQSGEPVDGSLDLQARNGDKVRFRFNGTGCAVQSGDGLDITIRIINAQPPSVADLKLEQEIIDNIIPDDGLVMVSGPTGSGKSTLLAAGIRHGLEDPKRHLRFLTFEDPIEYVYYGVKSATSHITQTEVSRFIKGGFPAAGRNYVRRAPNVILFGEARDRETMDGAMEGANTGHAVITTVHSQGVPETIKRVADLYQGEDKSTKMMELLDCLRMVVSQQLVPRLQGGRVSIREYMVFDAELRERLSWIEDPNRLVAEIRSELKKRGTTMYAHAQRLHAAGEIADLCLEKFRRRESGHERINLENNHVA